MWDRCVRAALATLVLCVALAGGQSLAQTVPAPPPMTINSLRSVDSSGTLGAPGDTVQVQLNGGLAVVLDNPEPTLDPTKFVLVLDGRPIPKLKDTTYRSSDKVLIFHLVRNADNTADWQPLLAEPTLTPRLVSVGLWREMPAKGTNPTPVNWTPGKPQTFQLKLISVGSLFLGGIAVFAVICVVWMGARKTNILKDSLLPQLSPGEQPFSLGRTQMAFWFAVVFAASVFLYVQLFDYNTLTSQALMLMGISAGTALFAVAIDATKTSPAGIANDALRAVGLNTYDDVVDLKKKIEAEKDPAALQQMQIKIALWEEIRHRFKGVDFFRDLTTDINGLALHRLQVVVWTLALGIVFLVDVYNMLAMPEFSATLLALMGVTSAGYLGFKIPEQQN